MEFDSSTKKVVVIVKKIYGLADTGVALDSTLKEILDALGGSIGITANVNVLTSVLPTGAATATLQTAGNASLTSIAGKDFATQATLALIKDTDGIKKITDAVAVTTLKPDGTNTAPSMDDAARAGWIQEKENVPTAASKNNPSTALTYDVDDQLTQIDMTIGAVVHRKTLTWTTGNLTAISAWSVV